MFIWQSSSQWIQYNSAMIIIIRLTSFQRWTSEHSVFNQIQIFETYFIFVFTSRNLLCFFKPSLHTWNTPCESRCMTGSRFCAFACSCRMDLIAPLSSSLSASIIWSASFFSSSPTSPPSSVSSTCCSTASCTSSFSLLSPFSPSSFFSFSAWYPPQPLQRCTPLVLLRHHHQAPDSLAKQHQHHLPPQWPRHRHCHGVLRALP